MFSSDIFPKHKRAFPTSVLENRAQLEAQNRRVAGNSQGTNASSLNMLDFSYRSSGKSGSSSESNNRYWNPLNNSNTNSNASSTTQNANSSIYANTASSVPPKDYASEVGAKIYGARPVAVTKEYVDFKIPKRQVINTARKTRGMTHIVDKIFTWV